MTLKQLLLTYLSSNKVSYQKLQSYVAGNSEFQEPSVRTTLSRLKRNGLAKKLSDKTWQLTPEGEELFQNKNRGLRNFFSKKKPTKKVRKEILLLFDVPEEERYKRDWLRSELIGLGFEMIQKSVWLGPKIPEVLYAYLKKEHLVEYIRIFAIKK